MKTLKQVREESKGTKKGELLDSAVKKAQVMDGVHNFDNVEVRSVEEMGDVAGDCDMRSKEMGIREDLTNTESGIRNSISKTLVHEGEHSRGTYSEGVTELVTTIKTGEAPNPHYAEHHQAAKELAREIGTQELVDDSRRHGAGAEVVILSKYVQKQVANNVHPEKARAKGQKLIKKAA